MGLDLPHAGTDAPGYLGQNETPLHLSFRHMPKPNLFEPSLNHAALDHAISTFHRYLHFPDPAPLYATLGCIAGNMMIGSPIWLMLVGSPSNIKSTLVEACYNLPYCFDAGQMKNSAAFLTIDKGINDGLLVDVGDFGILLYSDFSQVLSLDKNAMTEVMDVLRGAYGGHYSRRTGTHGGKKYISWDGKLGALGAVTPQIDHVSQAADLGERWVYYRLPDADTFQQGHKALTDEDVNPQVRNQALASAVAHVIAEMGIDHGMTRRSLTTREINGIAMVAEVACGMRAVVRRDNYTREVIDRPQREGSGRISRALNSMYLGMEACGVGEQERWRVVRKIGLDCAPGLRVNALKLVCDLNSKQVEVTPRNMHEVLMVSCKTAERMLEELKLCGAVVWDDDAHGYYADVKYKKVVEVL